MIPKVFAVIGRGYGDEGKGLVTDWLAGSFKHALVVRHNGGAQAGHTVERPVARSLSATTKESDTTKNRFVFHEIGSGTLAGADTYWGKTFLPDLYKLEDEILALKEITGNIPKVYASKDTCITVIDDVLLNEALEESRGSMRHGSCGMGIYEATLRAEAGFKLSLEEVNGLSLEELINRLKKHRKEYLPKRISDLNLNPGEEFHKMLSSDLVLENFANEIKQNMKYVELVDDTERLFSSYEAVIFESGQGLLLDTNRTESYPHVTASNTGLDNILDILSDTSYELDEVIYVSRSYLTRHGAGPLPNECPKEALGGIGTDLTNQPNPWQGTLRYAYFEDEDTFFGPVIEDVKKACNDTSVSLFITHLNETDNKIMFAAGEVSINAFEAMARSRGIEKIYQSNAPFGHVTCNV